MVDYFAVQSDLPHGIPARVTLGSSKNPFSRICNLTAANPFSRICNPTAANISICNAKSIADRELEKKELRIENADIHYGWITNPAERGAGEEGFAH